MMKRQLKVSFVVYFQLFLLLAQTFLILTGRWTAKAARSSEKWLNVSGKWLKSSFLVFSSVSFCQSGDYLPDWAGFLAGISIHFCVEK